MSSLYKRTNDGDLVFTGFSGWGEKSLTDERRYDTEVGIVAKAQDDMPRAWSKKPRTAIPDALKARLEKAHQKRNMSMGEGSLDLRLISEVAFGELFQFPAQRIGSCFPAGTLIRMADGSHKPIEKVHVFNQVLTAEGNVSYVSCVMGREAEGLYEVKLWGHSDGIRMTEEHPLLTKRGYVEAKDLRMDDYVCMPKYLPNVSKVLQTESHVRLNSQMRRRIASGDVVGSHAVFASGQQIGSEGGRGSVKVYRKVPDLIELTPEFGYLVGLALAEGGTDGNKVVFTFHIEEESTLAADVVRIFADCFDIEASMSLIHDKNTCKVSVHSVAWASLFDSIIGKRSHGKRIHSDLMSGPKEFLQAVWEGWTAGDGYERNGKMQGTTVSKQLAYDMHAIAQGLGLLPTINASDPKASHGVKNRRRRYDVYVRSTGNDPMCCEVEDSCTWRKVRSISQVDFKGRVYNFEVAGDNSYVAQGIGVHNCVESGGNRAWTFASMWQLLVNGDPEELLGHKRLSVDTVSHYGPMSYGLGRRRGNMRRGDGSYCGVQVESYQKDGVLDCNTPQLHRITGTDTSDFPEPRSTSLYRAFGSWRYLDDLLPYCDYKLNESVKVRDADQSVQLLYEYYPHMICSGWGFAPTRDKVNGYTVYKRSGSWSHNMSIIGVLTGSNGNEYIIVLNSWGPNAHRDGEIFVIPIELYARWLRSASCIAIGDIELPKSTPSIF